MNTEEHIHLKEAGKELALYADAVSQFDSRTRSEILFPYIFFASKKLSSRAISRWLSENKGIDFSAASVAKVLRESDKYFSLISERVQPFAEHLCEQFDTDPKELLFEPFGPDLLDEKINQSHPGEDAIGYTDKVRNELHEEWFSLDEEIRFRCRPFFDFSRESQTEIDNEE